MIMNDYINLLSIIWIVVYNIVVWSNEWDVFEYEVSVLIA